MVCKNGKLSHIETEIQLLNHVSAERKCKTEA